MNLLEVDQLRVQYRVKQGFGKGDQWVSPVDGVSLEIAPGETVGLVGESGCGKSTLARAIIGLAPAHSGSIRFEGRELTGLSFGAMRPVRRRLQMVFQDPYGSLDPRLTIEDIIGEALDIHGLAGSRRQRRARVAELLRDVGLDPAHLERYPHEFSGGQRQRIGIARALAVEPKLLICDEPVSALDVSVQAQVINLLRDLQDRRRLAYLFIAHDLAVVEHISRRILVMYFGRIVESGPAREVCGSPKHPYTEALLSAAPTLGEPGRKRIVLKGEIPSLADPPRGCAFAGRCPLARPECRETPPSLVEVAPGRQAACHLVEP